MLLCTDCKHVEANAFLCCVDKIGTCICLSAAAPRHESSVGLWIVLCGLTAAALQRLFWHEDSVLRCSDCTHLEAHAILCCVDGIGVCICLSA